MGAREGTDLGRSHWTRLLLPTTYSSFSCWSYLVLWERVARPVSFNIGGSRLSPLFVQYRRADLLEIALIHHQVIRYDQAREPLVLTDLASLGESFHLFPDASRMRVWTFLPLSHTELYILQNSRESIRRRRLLRTTLRSLEDQTLTWPFTTSSLVGKQSLLPFSRRRHTSYDSLVTYTTCTLQITRQGSLPWKGHDLASGFEVRLKYAKGVFAESSEIGLADDFEVTGRLAEFLSRNERVVKERLPGAMTLLDDYRSGMAREVEGKREVMGYSFLKEVYETPMRVGELERVLEKGGGDGKIRWLARDFRRELKVAEERRKVIFGSKANALWFLFWVSGALSLSPPTYLSRVERNITTDIHLSLKSQDDLWRRNRAAIPQVRKHASDFSPYSSTSIAYRPLPRALLVAFLSDRSLWPHPNRKGFFGNHILNLLYWSLNEAQFHVRLSRLFLSARDSLD